jgi:hypothetical protein
MRGRDRGEGGGGRRNRGRNNAKEALLVSGSDRSCRMGSMRIRVCNCVSVQEELTQHPYSEAILYKKPSNL